MFGSGILWGIAGCLAAVATSFACASDEDDSAATGTLGATCFPDDTCDEGLVCKADRCLAPVSSDASSSGGALNAGGSGGVVASGGTRPAEAGSGGAAGNAGRGGSGGLSGAGGTIGLGGSGGTGGIAGAGGIGAVMCQPQTAGSPCDECVQTYCCDEWLACTDDCVAEAPCIVECTDAAHNQNGFVDEQALFACASSCAVGPVIAATTDGLISCVLEAGTSSDASTTDCALECFSL